jgi:hypothetical protein
MQLYPDWTITLACGAKCPYVPSTVEDWDIADPPGKPIEKVRSIRDDIEDRVKDLVHNRIEAIREIADEILDQYEKVPIRSFTMTLANRSAREILRRRTPAEVA